MRNEPVTNVVEEVVKVAQSETFQKKPWIIASAALGFFLLLVSYIAITQKNSGEAAYKQISKDRATENVGLKKTNDLLLTKLNQSYDSIRKLNNDLYMFELRDSILKSQTRITIKESYKK